MESKRSALLVRLFLALLLVSLLALGTTQRASAGSIVYVKYSAGGLNNGTSWPNAYRSLQTALSHAVSGQQIWVAKGTYKPTTGTSRSYSFILKNGVAIYGGFAGGETSLSQRKPTVNITVLSGDIGAAGVLDDSYHVVKGGATNNTAILDGFTITAGNADGATYPDTQGGAGIYDSGSSPTLRNLVIQGNYAIYGGGMINLLISKPKLSKVQFIGNHASQWGGAMYNDSSTISLSNATFSANLAFNEGGAIYDYKSSLTLTNGTFTGNSATSDGGALETYQGSTMLNRVTFSKNSSPMGGAVFFSTDSPVLTNVNFISNSAGGTGGGAVYNYNSSGSFSSITFSGNSAPSGNGGAIYDDGNSPKFTNVTLVGNKTGGAGGAMYNHASTPALKNVTISGNTATIDGGAMYNDGSSSPTIDDSVVWGNGTEIVNATGPITISNSIVQGGCPLNSNCTNVGSGDPHLGPLQNNGGFTRTEALGAGSAAINAVGIPSTCAPKDQRGVNRPQGDGCDVGAYEVRALTFISQAANDGQVLESAKGSNVGGSLNSTSSLMRVGDDGSDRRYRSYASFGTATLPDAAKPVMAVLSVRQETTPTGNPFSTLGKFVADLSKPYFGAAVSLAVSDFQAPATVYGAGMFVSDSTWYNSQLTSAALGAINKAGTTQFRLRFSLSDSNHAADYLTLFSGNEGTAASRPHLTVYYNP